MRMPEWLRDEREAAWREGYIIGLLQQVILSILAIKDKDMDSKEMEQKISPLMDADRLSDLVKNAVQAESIQEFEQELEKCLMQYQEQEKYLMEQWEQEKRLLQQEQDENC